MPELRPGEPESFCGSCGQALRLGAQFCSACGYSHLTEPASPSGTETRLPVTQVNGLANAHLNALMQVGELFGLLLCSSLVLGLISRSTSSPWADVVFNGIDALVAGVFLMMTRRDVSPLLRAPAISLRQASGLAGSALVFMLAMAAYFQLIEKAGVPFYRATASYLEHGWPLWSMFLMISVLPAVVEEIAFRGVIQCSLEHVLGAREAWLIQAALFSVLHLLPIIFPSHFAMGLFFGYLRLRSKSLYPGMLVHASWNALSLCEELYWT
ncbi:CPBP family intramembrane glutamic endopeptidase [Noviherbaspirillum massiliense]|uniref:CPBP family intramembrane glutamic endopeptidase n=1 Tax=Noviherbaspirillum massiliense TaxID=1465823 RepID=UPI0009D95690|nr:CPBP family intramembrane glutamic endopeptidase [Noviherbaspirillum massiliense]